MSALLTAPAAPPAAPGAPRPWRVTRAEYHRLGELGFFAGRRVQLVRGEVLVMSPMGGPHQVGVLLATEALRAAFGAGHQYRVQLPLPVGGCEPEPDVAVARGGPRDPVSAAAMLLVVEVSDTTLQFDLTEKAELYAEAGIADYWVVDLAARGVRVLRGPRAVSAGGHRYFDVRTLREADSLAPLAAPAAPVRVADLLP